MGFDVSWNKPIKSAQVTQKVRCTTTKYRYPSCPWEAGSPIARPPSVEAFMEQSTNALLLP